MKEDKYTVDVESNTSEVSELLPDGTTADFVAFARVEAERVKRSVELWERVGKYFKPE